MTRIAVLLTAFNRRETTLRCLRDLEKQVLPPGVEVCIYLVDDGSTDGTALAVREQHQQVRLIEGTGSLYWTGGMALADAVAWSEGPSHLLWLNDDVELEADAIQCLLDASSHVVDSAIVVGAVADPRTGEPSYGGHRVRRGGRPLDLAIVAPTGELKDVDTMNGNVVLVPAAVRRNVGPPDTAFAHNMADMDYAFRARKLGSRVVLAPRFVGRCSPNIEKARWKDPQTPLSERIRAVRSFRGLPPREWLLFTRRHTGWRWPRYFVSPYLRCLVPSIGMRKAGSPARLGTS